MRVFRDYQGLAIRLTEERLAHILEHPEMAGMEEAIAETLQLRIPIKSATYSDRKPATHSD